MEVEVKHLAKVFATMQGLETLILWQNNIKGEEMKILLESLKSCKNLRELDLSDNYLDDEAIPILIELLKCDNKIELLKIADCNVSEEGTNLIKEFMEDCERSLKVLTYNYNEIENIKEFAEALKNHKSLTRLEIKGICEEEDHKIVKDILPNCEVIFESDYEDDGEAEDHV